MKKCLDRAGKSASLNKIVQLLNHMARAGRFGAPLSVFLGRAIRSNLPNSQNRKVYADENIRKREERAEKWATKKGKQYNADKFEMGD